MNNARVSVLAIAFVAICGCATVPPDQDPVLIKLTELESRLVRIERVMDNQSMMELVTQMEQLQAETRELRGQVEEASHKLDIVERGQASRYSDLDERLVRLERGPSQVRTPGNGVRGDSSTTEGAGALVPVGSDRDSYQVAFDLLKDGQYDEAGKSFQNFLAIYPDSALADNAQYWYAVLQNCKSY